MNDIKKSLQIINEDANTAATGAAKNVAAPVPAPAGSAAKNIAKKVGSKIIPVVGPILSWQDAWERWKNGDRSGAVIAALAGAAFMVPGPGTMAGTALDAANIGRDIKAGAYDELGQTIKDKISGKNTTESIMNNAEHIAALKNKIDEVQLNEWNPFAWIAKQAGKVSKGGKTPPPGAPGGPPKVEPGMYPSPAVRPDSAVATRPAQGGPVGPAGTMKPKDPNVIDVDAREVKPGMTTGQRAAATAAAATAAGTAGYMAGGSGSSSAPAAGSSANPPAAQSGSGAAGARPAAQSGSGTAGARPAASSGLSRQEASELDALAAELEKEMGRLPELDALLLRHTKLKGVLPGGSALVPPGDVQVSK